MSEIDELWKRCVELHRAGQLSVAVQGYAAILQADPEHADAWHLSGVAALQSGRLNDAVTCLQQAIALRPCESEYHSNLASALLRLGQTAAAADSARTAVRLNPQSGAAHFQLARAAAQLDATDEALTALEAAAALGFDRPRVLAEMGFVLQQCGQQRDSIAAFEQSLAHHAVQPAVWYGLSRFVATGAYSFQTSALHQMQQFLDSPANDRDLARTSFALATHFDAASEYGTAFELYRRGNACTEAAARAAGAMPTVLDRTALTDSLIAQFPVAVTRSLSAIHESHRPLLIVGMPRSGTTLLEQMLTAHPRIGTAGESKFWGEAADQLIRENRAETVAAGLTDEWRRETGNAYIRCLQDAAPQADRVIDKMPENYLWLGIIATTFPDAVIVHCQRDPRDLCLSAYFQLFDNVVQQWFSADLRRLAERCLHYDRLMQHWHQVFPGRILDVPYERLVRNPEPWLRQILTACGLSWSDTCLEFHSRGASVRTASAVQVRQPLHAAACGRWQHYASHLTDVTSLLADPIARYARQLKLAEPWPPSDPPVQ